MNYLTWFFYPESTVGVYNIHTDPYKHCSAAVLGGKMTKKMICLANSKKFNERCVAGIEVDDASGSYKILSTGSNPTWLRPVSNSEHGEFPTNIAQNISLLDVIEFDLLAPCPSGYQTENVYFAEGSVKKVASILLSEKNLDKLTTDTDILLFGNRGKAVHEDVVNSLDHSLIFIKVNEYNVFIKPVNNQLRMNFTYNSVEYDLPITDIKFDALYRSNEGIIKNVQNIYLTISLAVVHNNWHSKLIAGIIYI